MTNIPPQIAIDLGITAPLQSVQPIGSGHIHDTYRATYAGDGKTYDLVHQRLNQQIFPDIKSQLVNIQSVTNHISQKSRRPALQLYLTAQGQPYTETPSGDLWRTYAYIPDSFSVDVAPDPQTAGAAGQAFGEFQRWLLDLPPDQLTETFPFFHHTPTYLAKLQHAVDTDPHDRVREAQSEIGFALEQTDFAHTLTTLLDKQELPLRIVHNDTKINNVLFHTRTHQPICIVDLDTVMPGLIHYDFGDMVRTLVSPTDEAETTLDRIQVRWPWFQALTDGYLSEMGPHITAQERDTLGISGRLITFEVGIRFLTDYLLGDVYFKVRHPQENLHRCRSQFRLAQCLLEQEERMQEYIHHANPS